MTRLFCRESRAKRSEARSAFALLLVLWSAVGCSSSSSSNDHDGAHLAKLQVNVFDSTCALSETCHRGKTPSAGLNLEAPVHAKLVEVPSSESGRPLVVPGDPEASFLFEKITSDTPSHGARMPLGQPLDAKDVESIRAWIVGGAPDD
jgi:hypothetical protein